MMDHLERARHLCTEISLQTYGRKPHEMHETAQWWKLQRAEAMVREIDALLKQEIADRG